MCAVALILHYFIQRGRSKWNSILHICTTTIRRSARPPTQSTVRRTVAQPVQAAADIDPIHDDTGIFPTNNLTISPAVDTANNPSHTVRAQPVEAAAGLPPTYDEATASHTNDDNSDRLRSPDGWYDPPRISVEGTAFKFKSITFKGERTLLSIESNPRALITSHNVITVTEK